MNGLLRPHMTKLTAIFQLVDGILIAGCYAIIHSNHRIVWQDKDTLLILISLVVFFVIAKKYGLYRSWRISTVVKESFNICTIWLYSLIILVFLGYLLQQLQYFRPQIIFTWLIATPISLCVWHVFARKVSHFLRIRNFNSRSVAILGYSELSKRLANTVNNATWMGLHFCGYYDDRICSDGSRLTKDDLEDEFFKGNLDDLVKMARLGDIDIIYITFPIFAEKRIQEIIRAFCDTTANVYLAHDFDSYNILSGRWDMLGEVPILSIHESPFHGVNDWTKRIEDILICIPILMLISIPCLIVAISIKLESPGPVIFKQRRYGLNGKEFSIWKFRSMKHIENETNVPQATKDDPRITKVGRFIRKSSIDELPQFLNVLSGKMSIIGPRPHAVVHNTKYRKIVDRYMLRHTVKPGITGWAQVNGFRGETQTTDKMKKRVEFDLFYIRNWSLLFDLKILFMTFKACIFNKNVY